MTKRTKAELILLNVTFIYGGTFALGKMALNDVSPFVFVATRFSLGALILGSLLFREFFHISTPTLRKGIALGVLFGTGLTLQMFGLRYTTASKSAFITGMFVVFTPVAQFLIERRLPKMGNLMGVGIVALGLFFLTSPNGSHLNVGDAVTLAAAVIFALHVVYLDILTPQENARHLTFLQIASAAAIGLLLVPFETRRFALTREVVGVLFYVVVLATLLNTFLFTRFQRDTTPTRAAVLYSMEPVFASVFAYVLLEERLGAVAVIGATLIVFGILISELLDSLLESLAAKPPRKTGEVLSASHANLRE
jgi:drug/metabolite transporter (DMT)-like permease